MLMSLSTPSEGEPEDQPLGQNDHNGSCNGAPASITLKNGTSNESNGCTCTPMTKENNESNCCTPTIKDGKFLLRPVPPFDSGEGLPYAPIDWPNPGDNWSWSVDQRIDSDGYYVDRYLYLPRGLQKPPGRNRGFRSKLSVERYIKSKFPVADIDAFFASFSWKVPSTKNLWTKVAVESSPLPPEGPAQVERVKVENEGIEETPPQIPRKRNWKTFTFPVKSKRLTRQSVKGAVASSTTVAGGKNDFAAVPSSKDMDGVIDLCSLDEETVLSESTDEDLKASSDSKGSQVSQQNNISHDHSFLPTCHSSTAIGGLHMKDPQESPDDAFAKEEDFDNYLDSLEDILAPPPYEASSSHLATINYLAVEHEMAESRRKLSSLLDMDFPSLVSSGNLSELRILAAKLRKDPSLSVDQLIKLKLIEEIPLISEAFLETKGIIQQADKFFSDLEVKKAKVIPLKNEYMELKDKAGQLQIEIDSSSSAVEEIDYQIAQLQCRRAELSSTNESKKKEKIKLASAQKISANSIRTFAGEMQLAYSEMPEWELKKINAANREVEILAKFATLKGFPF